MKTFALLCLFCLHTASACADPRAAVVIHPSATVSGDYFNLSDIATVTCRDTTFRLQLMNAVMGRCPLAGLTRPFDEGDVTLKLRQAGVDPETVAFSGSTQLMLTGVGQSLNSSLAPASAPAAPGSTSTSAITPSASSGPVVHYGDNLTLIYDCDGMTISAGVVALSAGAVGDTINLRRDGAERPLQGIIQDAQTVKLVE